MWRMGTRGGVGGRGGSGKRAGCPFHFFGEQPRARRPRHYFWGRRGAWQVVGGRRQAGRLPRQRRASLQFGDGRRRRVGARGLQTATEAWCGSKRLAREGVSCDLCAQRFV